MPCEQKISSQFNSDPPSTDYQPCTLLPLVGILTTTRDTVRGQPVGKRARLFKEMSMFASRNGIKLFFFYPQDVIRSRRMISGLVPTPRGWIRSLYPLPDVVYNRITYRDIERQQTVYSLLRYFENHPQVYLFNTRFLDKWEVYQAIKRAGMAGELLPDTELLSREKLKCFGRDYEEIFVKPRNGSKGVGIIKIKRAANGTGFFYARVKSEQWKYAGSIDYLYRAIASICIPGNRYLLQQGVDLARVGGRIFDIRAQVQKDGKGQWIFTGAGVRIAAGNRFVTHIPNGGKAASFDETIGRVFDNSPKTISSFKTRLMEIALLTAGALDQELGLTLGILSEDIGIDKEGRMQVLEVNSKPASFDEDDIRWRHLQYLMDYFRFLALNKHKRNDNE